MPGFWETIALDELVLDFPVGPHAPGAVPNGTIDTVADDIRPAQTPEAGDLEGLPVLHQRQREDGELKPIPYHDLNLDVAQMARLVHTARLSGPLIQLVSHDRCQSVIRVEAQPIARSYARITLVAPIVRSLQPAAPAPNVWFWRDKELRRELILTAQADFSPNAAGLRSGHVYRLILVWELWDLTTEPMQLVPISRRHHAILFGVAR